MEIIQREVLFDGCAINVLKTGDPKGKDVLMLHGMSFQDGISGLGSPYYLNSRAV